MRRTSIRIPRLYVNKFWHCGKRGLLPSAFTAKPLFLILIYRFGFSIPAQPPHLQHFASNYECPLIATLSFPRKRESSLFSFEYICEHKTVIPNSLAILTQNILYRGVGSNLHFRLSFRGKCFFNSNFEIDSTFVFLHSKFFTYHFRTVHRSLDCHRPINYRPATANYFFVSSCLRG